MAVSFDFKKRLGAGHFGDVWLVTDMGLLCDFALKCIPPENVINPRNFYQEAQAIKIAEHPNIIHVTETGSLDDGRIYIKMEYLENGSLEDEAKGAYVPITRAKKLMIDVLRGLEYAHSKGLVHRDIKPANILIGDAREGKLSDFGLALPNIDKLDTSTIKQYQYFLHLAPEVQKVGDYTTLSDIYSCGVTLYSLVNGDSRLPSLPVSELRQLSRRGKFPDRDNYRDFVPLQLRKVINKALSVNPIDRYQTADKMRHALEQVPLLINWTENKISDGTRWRTAHNNVVIQIKKTKNGSGKFDIEVKKGMTKESLRRTNRLCSEDIDHKQADKKTKKILQDFVTGKEK
jgi:serine/threonine protein kinase